MSETLTRPTPTHRPAMDLTAPVASARRTPPISPSIRLDAPVARPAAEPWAERAAGAFATPRGRRRYLVLMAVLGVLAAGFALGVLAWDNPMPLGSEGFWRIAEMRAASLAVIALVALCQGVATICFQTVANNRIITPSILGFESLYVLMATVVVYYAGISGLTGIQGPVQYVIQILAMVGFAAVLYGWLLTGKYGDLHSMLLIGIILGGGLAALSSFLRRMLTPAEFDVLTARMLGSISNASVDNLAIAAPVALGAAATLFALGRKLNVLSLGVAAATNLGVNPRGLRIAVLLLVAVLMAVTTSLVGPMAFLGFLIAMITYQLADTYDHRLLLPMSWLVGFTVLTGAYFILKHIFYAQGAVGIVVEIVGGSFFLIYLMRKGRL